MTIVDARTRIQLQNILFATDFSAAAQAAIPYAAGLAKHFGAALCVVHVRPVATGPLMAPGTEHGAARAARIDAERQTKRILASFPETRPEVLIEEGDVWSRIEDVIASRDIDLVVTGTRGRAGVAKLFLGSVAEKIFRTAGCPVLTVGPHSRASGNLPGEMRTILLAADLNPQSTAASYAVSLAQEYQARLILLCVIGFGELTDLPRSAELLRYLVPVDAELWCSPEYIVERGDVAGTILSIAAERQADLIVMGARRPDSPGASAHLPSTAQKVVSQAGCPVLTVRT
jgi:nucleotide-binding universal stress UspA family protein